MTGLPRPETLSAKEALALVRRIRGEMRPRQLEILRDLYSTDDGDVGLQGQILAEEFQLQSLDNYAVSLLPILVAESGPLGWEIFQPEREGLERLGHHSVRALVEMAYSPENHECVHGPSTAVPVLDLASEILFEGEIVREIERITWALPLRHKVDLAIWDTASQFEDAPEPKEGTFFGSLKTSRGRQLMFVGTAITDQKLVDQRDYNRLSLALVRGQSMSPMTGSDWESVVLSLSEQGLGECRDQLSSRPGMSAATLLDLVPVAILNWRRGRPMVACGYRDVALPSLEEAFGAGSLLEVRYRRDLSHTSTRSGLLIAYYEFRYSPWQEAWSTMVMAEAKSPQALLRKLHS